MITVLMRVLIVGAGVFLGEPQGMFGPPSLWPWDFEQVLCDRGSPACEEARQIWHEGVRAEVDPNFLLAFFAKESTFGTAGAATRTRNIGNIICTQNWQGQCSGRWRVYESWTAAARDWYSLMSRKYRGMSLIEQLELYAPYSDGNDPQAYAAFVIELTNQWRTR